jgi:hypothetical protein
VTLGIEKFEVVSSADLRAYGSKGKSFRVLTNRISKDSKLSELEFVLSGIIRFDLKNLFKDNFF